MIAAYRSISLLQQQRKAKRSNVKHIRNMVSSRPHDGFNIFQHSWRRWSKLPPKSASSANKEAVHNATEVLDASKPKRRKRVPKEDVLQCLGKTKSGQSCRSTLSAKEHYKFCRQHRPQANDVPCKIRELPAEILYKVVDCLRPHERVALALTNQNLAATIKAWGEHERLTPIHKPQILVREIHTYPFTLIKPQHARDYNVVGPGIMSQSDRLLQPTKEGRATINVAVCETCGSVDDDFFQGPLLYAPMWYLNTTPDPLGLNPKTLNLAMETHPYLFAAHRNCLGCHQSLTKKDCTRSPMFCVPCDRAYEYYLRWCHRCKGAPEPLDFARIWWLGQKKKFNSGLLY